ncbi:flagellar motor switch protein FliM [Variovorax sp. VNK109]|jgi:flagellar motor switch protein FliM|uniref:flagellar motor switch protein FliM n=1 Tax=Variovorax sp. VNK109 TaxID=3400919 RepID=UPI003C02A59B
MSEAQEAPQQAAEEAASPPAPAAAGGMQRYDLVSKERVVSDRMPTMDIVNERFARYFQSGLFTMLRRHADVKAGAVSVQRHSEFMGSLEHPTHLNIITLNPLRGHGLVTCGMPLLFGMVEGLYGGPGILRGDLEARELSATEQRVLSRLLKVACEEYKRAWKGIHEFEPAFVRSETLPQFAAVCGPLEIVVVTSFEIAVGELTGTIHIAMPYTALEPMRDLLYASPLGDVEAIDRRWVSRLTREIQSAEITLSAQLATADVTIEQLLTMQPGDFIELDREPRIEASVDGVPLFKCLYGTHNGKYAIRVDECLGAPGENHGE